MTPAEKLLWEQVRAGKLGVRIRPPPASPKFNDLTNGCESQFFIVEFGGGARRAVGVEKNWAAASPARASKNIDGDS